MEKNEPLFVGIDVAKDALVVHVLPTHQQLTVPNDTTGIKNSSVSSRKRNPRKSSLKPP
jgi:hypothetical protein